MKIVDMHCDTIMKVYDSRLAGAYQGLAKNDWQIDGQKLRQGAYLLQNFALYLDKATVVDPYQQAKDMSDCFYQEMAANQSWIAPVTTYQEILRNQQAGKISALLTMEEGAPLAGLSERLHEFYDLGVRMLTLTWNYPNELGYPNAVYYDEATSQLASQQQGLTAQGRLMVTEMEALGMIIDVSHGSDQLVRDVWEQTKAPFVASHSNAREVCGHPRNLPDELIRKIAERGGVIGLNFAEDFIRRSPAEGDLLTGLVRHAKHLHKVGGIDCLGLGSDFDGIPVQPELGDATVLPNLLLALAQAGFSAAEIDKIAGENVLRLYREVLK